MEGKSWDHRQLAKAPVLGGRIHFTLSDSCSHSVSVRKRVCRGMCARMLFVCFFFFFKDYVRSSVNYANVA